MATVDQEIEKKMEEEKEVVDESKLGGPPHRPTATPLAWYSCRLRVRC